MTSHEIQDDLNHAVADDDPDAFSISRIHAPDSIDRHEPVLVIQQGHLEHDGETETCVVLGVPDFMRFRNLGVATVSADNEVMIELGTELGEELNDEPALAEVALRGVLSKLDEAHLLNSHEAFKARIAVVDDESRVLQLSETASHLGIGPVEVTALPLAA